MIATKTDYPQVHYVFSESLEIDGPKKLNLSNDFYNFKNINPTII